MTSPLWMPHDGAALLIPSGPSKHLFIVATTPCSINQVAVVNVTGIVEGIPYDPACVLQPGDHEFIHKPSFLYYAKSTIVPVGALISGVARGEYAPKRAVASELFERVCDGFGLSERVPQKVAAYVSAQFARS